MNRLSTNETFLWIALWIGAIAFGLSILLFGFILVLRLRKSSRIKKEQQFVSRWLVVLNDASNNSFESLLPIPGSMMFLFMRLWNELFESNAREAAGGDGDEGEGTWRKRMLLIAETVGVEDAALKMLAEGSVPVQAVVSQTLSLIGSPRAISGLEKLTISDNPYSALLGVRRLLESCNLEAKRKALGLLGTRKDWPDQVIHQLLDSVDAPERSILLSEIVQTADSTPEGRKHLRNTTKVVGS